MPALPEVGVCLGLARTFDFQHGVVEYTLKLSMWRRQRQEDICELTRKEKRKEKPKGASEVVWGGMAVTT